VVWTTLNYHDFKNNKTPSGDGKEDVVSKLHANLLSQRDPIKLQ
jgi:hypothetical protein